MNTFARALLSFVVAATACAFSQLILMLLLPFDGGIGGWLGGLLALVLAFLAGRAFWKFDPRNPPGTLGCIVIGSLLVGGLGFFAGFVGPMILAPGANQGPLLGIFITGPLGFLAGAVGGLVYSLKRR